MNFKRLKTLIKKNYLYFFIFVFFLYINFLSPLIGDDWEIRNWFPLNANGDIILAIRGIYDNWLTFNGRGLSNFLMSFFCYYKILWNFTSALVFCLIVYIFSHILGYKTKKISTALSILLILSVSNGIRMETYSLICANIAFLIPLTLILIYQKNTQASLESVDNKSRQKYPLSYLIFYSTFCLIISTLMENISIGFTVTLGIINLYVLIKNKKFDKLFLISFICSLLGSILMITSPGIKITREVYDQSLGLIGTLKFSLPRIIHLTIIENKFIFFIITTITLISIITNSIKIPQKIIKYIYLSFLTIIIFVLIIPLITPYVFNPWFFDQIFALATRLSNFFLTNRFSISIFWLIFLLSFSLPIFYIKKNNKTFYFLFFIAIFSLIPASLITQTGARIITITVIFFIGLGSGILNEIKLTQKINQIIYGVLLFGIFVQANKLIVIYRNIAETQSIRKEIIEDTVSLQRQNLWDFEKTLTIPKLKNVYPTANPNKGEFHYSSFLKYYKLNPDTIVVFN